MKCKIILILVVMALALIGTAGFLGYRTSQANEPLAPEIPPTVNVERGDVDLTVTAPGQLVTSGETTLQSGVNGWVEELAVKAGEQVKAGQVLAVLGERNQFERALADAEMKVLEAQMELDKVSPDLALSQAELELVHAQKAYREAEGKRASKNYERGSEANIEAARAKYLLAEKALKDADEDYRKVDHLAEHDIRRVMGLSLLASARQDRDRALANLNNLEGKPGEKEIAEADAEVEVARAKLEEAQRRVDQLKNGQNMEQELAEARLKNARASLEAAQADLQSLEILAPFDGVVTEVNIQVGQNVSTGMEILTLIDPEALEVEATVVEEDLPLVEVGQQVQLFFDALPEAQVTGKVSRIVPKRVPGDRALYSVTITPDEVPERLAPGMTVDASVVIEQQKDVLRLPRSVLRSISNDQAQVQVWTNGQVERRSVQVGLRGDSFAEILSGLKEGEQVVAR